MRFLQDPKVYSVVSDYPHFSSRLQDSTAD